MLGIADDDDNDDDSVKAKAVLAQSFHLHYFTTSVSLDSTFD